MESELGLVVTPGYRPENLNDCAYDGESSYIQQVVLVVCGRMPVFEMTHWQQKAATFVTAAARDNHDRALQGDGLSLRLPQCRARPGATLAVGTGT